jgi:hypothetical protein
MGPAAGESESSDAHPLRTDGIIVSHEANPWPGAVEEEEDDE